ncbi:unnamed protein product [Prunus brigantina]
MKGVEFAWSTSLCRASSKFPPIFKLRSRSFTSFSTSSMRMAYRSRWRPS